MPRLRLLTGTYLHIICWWFSHLCLQALLSPLLLEYFNFAYVESILCSLATCAICKQIYIVLNLHLIQYLAYLLVLLNLLEFIFHKFLGFFNSIKRNRLLAWITFLHLLGYFQLAFFLDHPWGRFNASFAYNGHRRSCNVGSRPGTLIKPVFQISNVSQTVN